MRRVRIIMMENDGDDADGSMLRSESPLLMCVQGLTSTH